MARYDIKYKTIISSQNKMMADLDQILDENQIVNPIRNHFKIAVSEAFTNALIHGNKLEANKIILVAININEFELSADIIDEGQDGLENIKNKKPATLVSESGRGVDLIKHFASQIEFKEIITGGLKVSIKFDRKERKIISK
jgi:serine/threonine-protein kinase RsbW